MTNKSSVPVLHVVVTKDLRRKLYLAHDTRVHVCTRTLYVSLGNTNGSLPPVALAMRFMSSVFTRRTAMAPASTKYLRHKSSIPPVHKMTLAPAVRIFCIRSLVMSDSLEEERERSDGERGSIKVGGGRKEGSEGERGVVREEYIYVYYKAWQKRVLHTG